MKKPRGCKKVRCPYCLDNAVLVTGDTIYPRRPDLHYKLFWLCRPCDAYVGCHACGHGDGSIPLGRLANPELRQWKMNAHSVFDALWKSQPNPVRRKEAYRWLAFQLGLTVKQCHIGWFDVARCKKVVDLCLQDNAGRFYVPETETNADLDLRFERAIEK